MGLKTFTIDFKNIGKQEFLRLNVSYRYFFDVQNATVYNFDNLIQLKYVLKELPVKKVRKGDLENEEYLIDIGNIERRFNNLINLKKVSEIGSDKNILQDGDIVIPKMQPQMGNIFLNTNHKRFIGSTELLEYSISEKYNPLFVYYLITSNKFLSDLSKLESGKTHRRVNPIDLLKIKIPLIPKSKQDQIVAQIEPIEKKIKELKAQIKEPQEIINEVFAREFRLNKKLFNEFDKGITTGTQVSQNKALKVFTTDFKNIGKQEFLRLNVSYRYFFDIQNATVYNFDNLIQLKYVLKKLPVKKVRKGDLENEEYLIDIGNIERRFNNLINLKKVSKIGSDKNILQDGDIVIPKIQPQMGNIFLNTNHKRFIGSTELLEYSISEKYNPLFVYYLITSNKFLSDLSKLESGKTHRRVNPIDLLKIKIPNIPLNQQQKIVDEIKAELDKQEEIKQQIESERNKIDEIIEKVIT